MILSVFFGGFGVDRFYLGHYKEGLGKLFSFGGLKLFADFNICTVLVFR
jgi:TM2 domain-containing membrane protein YozV